jgi:alpha-1,3-mannosyltransferase
MPIKVAHVVRQYYPSIGGMEDVVQNIAHYQARCHGHIPTIITLNRVFVNPADILPADEVVNGVRVIRIPYKGSTRYPFSPGVLRLLGDYDVVHVHGVDFAYDYLAATKWLHRRPLVASTHGGFFHTSFASRLKTIFFNTVTRATSHAYGRVVGTSDNDGNLFGKIIKAPRLTVIENGVNVEKYRGKGSATKTPCIMYFGRWSSNKGLKETLELFAELAKAHPEWRLVIAGREYDLSRADLEALARDKGIAERITIAANPSDAQLAELMSQSSYYICLSRHEGFGIAAIEAMSAGLTPVLSDIPPFRNLLEKAQLGILHTGQVAQTVEAIVAAHAQDQAAYAARRVQLQDFSEQYSWNHIGGRYVDIYEELLRKQC